MRKPREHTQETAAVGVEQALKMLEGRWKLLILFHLSGGRVLRFSELAREIRGVSEKRLAQQLRQLETAGLVRRTIHAVIPPKVEYGLTGGDRRSARRSTLC